MRKGVPAYLQNVRSKIHDTFVSNVNYNRNGYGNSNKYRWGKFYIDIDQHLRLLSRVHTGETFSCTSFLRSTVLGTDPSHIMLSSGIWYLWHLTYAISGALAELDGDQVDSSFCLFLEYFDTPRTSSLRIEHFSTTCGRSL